MTPAMGPTAACSWQGENLMAPDAASCRASSGVCGLAFVQQSADDGSAHRPAHSLPGNRRSSVQEHVFFHARDHFNRSFQTHQMRHAAQDDLGTVAFAASIAGCNAFTFTSSRPSTSMGGFQSTCTAVTLHIVQRLLEPRQPKVDHLQLAIEQLIQQWSYHTLDNAAGQTARSGVRGHHGCACLSQRRFNAAPVLRVLVRARDGTDH